MFSKNLSRPKIQSLAWRNIDQRIVQKQAAVFEYLKIPLSQQIINKKDHGEWMNESIERASVDETLIFCDIDAFPLKSSLYERSLSEAEDGKVFGMAQYSNRNETAGLYAGPMYLAFKKSTWLELGKPSLMSTDHIDVAEALSICASEANRLEIVSPTFSIFPKWSLKNTNAFGVGTFYGEMEFFHLFESRKSCNINLFENVANQAATSDGVKIAELLSFVHRKRFKFAIDNEFEHMKDRIKRFILRRILKKARLKR